MLVTGGTSARRQAVMRGLESVNATISGVAWEEYPEALEPGFAAMVVTEPLPVSLAGAVAAIRGHREGANLTLYALADGAPGRVKARNAYLAGANAVIDWPREKELFAGILAETMGMSLVRGQATRPDVALARTARAHLRLGPRPGSAIRLRVRKGVVALSGEARSLAELREVVETIAAVPGVGRVLTADLRVAPSGIPDSTIKRDVKSVIRATSEIDEKALRVAVRGGRVVLRGEVPERAGFQDLLDVIAAVRGVRDLDWQVTVTGRGSGSGASASRRLREMVRLLHPNEAIDLVLMADVAVLSGRVGSLAVKRAVERLVARDDAVDRVVNKLTVGRR